MFLLHVAASVQCCVATECFYCTLLPVYSAVLHVAASVQCCVATECFYCTLLPVYSAVLPGGETASRGAVLDFFYENSVFFSFGLL